MKKSPIIFIHHILESIKLIELYTSKMTKEDFKSNIEKQDSVLRRLEIIGEAIKNVPEDIRIKYPHIEWKAIAGTRDIIIHEYFRIDIDLIWEVLQCELSDLKIHMKNLLKDIEKK